MPEGVMDAKVEEFRNISQGSQKVQEYTTHFTRMMRYASGETDTEKKKMYCFKKGLNPRLKVVLSGHAFAPFARWLTRCWRWRGII
jgi:hypothetical protein